MSDVLHPPPPKKRKNLQCSAPLKIHFVLYFYSFGASMAPKTVFRFKILFSHVRFGVVFRQLFASDCRTSGGRLRRK